MLRHHVSFEEKKDENEVKIYISANCPLGFVHDVLFKARSYVIEKMNESLKQDVPKEEVKPEENKSE